MEKIYRVQMNSKGMPDFSTAVELEPYEYTIKALHKEYKEPYCEITECDYHEYCKERGQTDCPWK